MVMGKKFNSNGIRGEEDDTKHYNLLIYHKSKAVEMEIVFNEAFTFKSFLFMEMETEADGLGTSVRMFVM